MNESMAEPLRIDIVSDVMCPWCIIGYKQLENALAATGTKAFITWHPFELNPQMPPGGQNFREHIVEKYGTSAEDSERSRAQMTQLGEELGFTFNFDDNMRMANTFLAHQLLHWAEQQGRQHELKMELFETHFTHQKNVGDINVLAEAAERVGLNKEDALAVLADQRFANDVREIQHFWNRQGIQGVPATVVNRRHLIQGAQGQAGFTQLLEQLALEDIQEEATSA